MNERTDVLHEVDTGRSNLQLDPSRLLGFIGFFGMIGLAMLLGGSIDIFINIPSLIVCFGGMLMLSILAFGFKDVARAAVLLCRVLTVTQVRLEAVRRRDIDVVRGMILHLYAAGAIGVFIGAVQMLAAMNDPESIGPASLGGTLVPVLFAPDFGGPPAPDGAAFGAPIGIDRSIDVADFLESI